MSIDREELVEILKASIVSLEFHRRHNAPPGKRPAIVVRAEAMLRDIEFGESVTDLRKPIPYSPEPTLAKSA